LSYVLSHINLIEPDSEDLRIIYTVSKKGWKDIFDSLLYATSIRKKLPLLTLDKEFVEFLANNGFDINNIIVLK
jgi:PIN domain nuclease of toxin-antitoxin system